MRIDLPDFTLDALAEAQSRGGLYNWRTSVLWVTEKDRETLDDPAFENFYSQSAIVPCIFGLLVRSAPAGETTSFVEHAEKSSGDGVATSLGMRH